VNAALLEDARSMYPFAYAARAGVFFAVITVIATAVVNLVHLVVACVVNRRGTTGKILA
jgi:hypothetical protein